VRAIYELPIPFSKNLTLKMGIPRFDETLENPEHSTQPSL
jgi:hypothetical protein